MRPPAPEQRTTAARAFHADRDLLSASKLILDVKNPAYRAVAAVRSEASTCRQTVTLPFRISREQFAVGMERSGRRRALFRGEGLSNAQPREGEFHGSHRGAEAIGG